MEKEEKALDVSIDALISRTQDLKNSLAAFLIKLETEYETLSWPSVLDSFALLSGQVNTLLKVLKNDKTPPLRNRVLLPIHLSPERDDELARLTENRVQAFNHEVVPDYLRTKTDPEIENRELQLMSKLNQLSMDAAQKQIASMNKIANNIVEYIKTNRENWETESGQRASATQTSSLTDTNALISAISLGKGLKPPTGSPKGQPTNPQPTPQQQIRPTSAAKAPSAIKTNIKSASAIHPYQR